MLDLNVSIVHFFCVEPGPESRLLARNKGVDRCAQPSYRPQRPPYLLKACTTHRQSVILSEDRSLIDSSSSVVSRRLQRYYSEMGTQSAWGTTISDLGGKSWAEDALEEEDVHGHIAVRLNLCSASFTRLYSRRLNVHDQLEYLKTFCSGARDS